MKKAEHMRGDSYRQPWFNDRIKMVITLLTNDKVFKDEESYLENEVAVWEKLNLTRSMRPEFRRQLAAQKAQMRMAKQAKKAGLS